MCRHTLVYTHTHTYRQEKLIKFLKTKFQWKETRKKYKHKNNTSPI